MTLRLALLIALAPGAAFAHVQGDIGGGLASGLLHPILGFDHLVAMVAVGVWGSILGAPLLFALPIAFPLMMAVGAVLGVLGVPLPGVELGVAFSAVALGAAVLFRFRPPTVAAVALVGVFALFHGHAHGGELDPTQSPAAYGIGFILATGALHLAGIGLGEAAKAAPRPERVNQIVGGFVAAVGAVFALSAAAGV
jgi:urease accessory protein